MKTKELLIKIKMTIPVVDIMPTEKEIEDMVYENLDGGVIEQELQPTTYTPKVIYLDD